MHTLLLNFMHDFLKEIYYDFCVKHDLPRNNDRSFRSADDYLYPDEGDIPLTEYQVIWLGKYINLWETTNGGEDL